MNAKAFLILITIILDLTFAPPAVPTCEFLILMRSTNTAGVCRRIVSEETNDFWYFCSSVAAEPSSTGMYTVEMGDEWCSRERLGRSCNSSRSYWTYEPGLCHGKTCVETRPWARRTDDYLDCGGSARHPTLAALTIDERPFPPTKNVWHGHVVNIPWVGSRDALNRRSHPDCWGLNPGYCYNGGTCVEATSPLKQPTCLCPRPWKGHRCLIRRNSEEE